MLNKLSSGFLGGTIAGGFILIVLLVFCGIKICNSSIEDIQSVMKENFTQFAISFGIFCIALIGLVVCLLIDCGGKSEESEKSSDVEKTKDGRLSKWWNNYKIDETRKNIRNRQNEILYNTKKMQDYQNINFKLDDDDINKNKNIIKINELIIKNKKLAKENQRSSENLKKLSENETNKILNNSEIYSGYFTPDVDLLDDLFSPSGSVKSSTETDTKDK